MFKNTFLTKLSSIYFFSIPYPIAILLLATDTVSHTFLLNFPKKKCAANDAQNRMKLELTAPNGILMHVTKKCFIYDVQHQMDSNRFYTASVRLMCRLEQKVSAQILESFVLYNFATDTMIAIPHIYKNA